MRCRLHEPSWNAALEAACVALWVLPDICPLDEYQLKALKVADSMIRGLNPRLLVRSVPTNRELCAKYQISLRTVTNWRREGCPFNEGQWAVMRWVGRRRYAPGRMREKFPEADRQAMVASDAGENRRGMGRVTPDQAPVPNPWRGTRRVLPPNSVCATLRCNHGKVWNRLIADGCRLNSIRQFSDSVAVEEVADDGVQKRLRDGLSATASK